jgi:hypothetical protein
MGKLPAARELDLLDDVQFAEATQAQLAKRQLLRRIDSKYVVPAVDIPDLLARLTAHYAVVRVPNSNWATYRSLYFDTPDLRCFHDHRRGRRVRRKVRIRHYPDRALSWLEVKTKRNGEMTEKARFELASGAEVLGDREREFVQQHFPAEHLAPVARVDYRRMMLIGLDFNERVTIDVGLEVAAPIGPPTSLGAFAVVEIKQAKLSASSPIMQCLVDAGHRQQSVSKYMTAIAQLHPAERKNRMLPTLRAVDRIAR